MVQQFSPSMPSGYQDISAEIVCCLDRWITAVGLREPGPVTALYDRDAVLLATFYPTPLTTMAERLDYFTTFTAKKNLRAVVGESYVKALGQDAGKIDGLYTFSFDDEDNQPQSMVARFTFIFERKPGGDWLILSHHSSKCIEQPRAQRS